MFTSNQFEDKSLIVIKKLNKEPKFTWFVAREVNKPLIVKINSDALKDHDGLNILHYQKIFNIYYG